MTRVAYIQLRRLPWLRSLAFLVGLIASGYILVFFLLAAIRVVYPFELEWLEGAMVDSIRWILQGNPLYGEPSIYFIPFAYNPLFFYVSAGLSKIIGVGFLAPRLISIIASGACFLLLYLEGSKTFQHPLPGLAAAGLFAASYRFTGAWLDLAKTDSLFLFLTLAAFFLVRRSTHPGKMALAGLLFVLAYYTKQFALPVIVGVAILSLLVTRGRSWPAWVTAVVAGLGAYLLLDRASGGWFSFYTLEAAAYHRRLPDLWYFLKTFSPRWAPALLVGSGYLAALVHSKRQGEPVGEQVLDIGFSAAMIAVSWVIFFNVWIYDNAYLPACLGLSLLAGWAVGQWIRQQRQFPLDRRGQVMLGASLCLLVIQWVLLLYNPLQQLPTARDREAAVRFIKKVAGLPGEVWIYSHGYYGALAGKTTYLTIAPYGEVTDGEAMPGGSEQDRRRKQVVEVFQQALSELAFDWIILDKPEAEWAPYYLYAGSFSSETDAFYPVTGALARPESLLVRNPIFHGGELPLQDPAYDLLFNKGWGKAKDWGRWATGQRSRVRIFLDPATTYRVSVALSPACEGKTLLTQEMQVGWKDAVLGEGEFHTCDRQVFTFDLPASMIIPKENRLWLEFTGLADPDENWASVYSIRFDPVDR